MQEHLKRGRIEHQHDFEERIKARLAKIREADPTAVTVSNGEDPTTVAIRGDNHWPMETSAPTYVSHFDPGTATFKSNALEQIRVLGHTFRKMREQDYLGYEGVERGSYMCEIESPNGPDDHSGFTTLFLLPDGSIHEQESAVRPGYLEGSYIRHWRFDDRWSSPMLESMVLADRVLILMPLEEGNLARNMIALAGAPAKVLGEIFDLDLAEPCWVQDGFRCALGETTVDDFGRPLCFVSPDVVKPIIEKAGGVIGPIANYLIELLGRPVVLYWARPESYVEECRTEIEVQLTGTDGNAFSIMAKVCNALLTGGRTDLIASFQAEATSGDYDNLLTTCMRYVRVS